MSALAPPDLQVRLGSGLLSFPVTSFTPELAFDEANFRHHCSWLLERDIAALFAAGGTGEFFSLTPAEVALVVRAAVSEARGRVPVVAGCGYGTALAIQLAEAAEAAGADGLLLLPPYLVNATQEGLAGHIEALCKTTGLGVVVYNRDNAVLGPETLSRLCARNANLVGFKDGLGDIELMTRIQTTLGDRLTYIGGLPTAETFAQAYLAMGVSTYSSAIFNFLPDWALRFYAAVRAGKSDFVATELDRFVLPYVALRSRRAGYAVSVVKAGLRLVGRSAGPVRPPLTDLTDEEMQLLEQLIASAAVERG